ncbi:MAG: hypothetical protein ACF8Q5_08625 [Phycisphaerales bacterium JB040]
MSVIEIASGGLAIVAIAVLAQELMGIPPTVAGIAAGLLLAPVIILVLSRDAVRRFRKRRALALRERLCPACWYSLVKVEPAVNGMTICPECGAGWKIPGDEAG